MARINIHHLKPGEELSHHRQHLIRHILTLGAPHKQRRLLKSHLPRVLERKISHMAERLTKNVNRHAESLSLLAGRREQIGKEELADGEAVFVCGYDFIGGFLGGDFGVLDPLHSADVLGKIGGENGVDRSVVDGDYVFDGGWRVESEDHGCLCTPDVESQDLLVSLVICYEKDSHRVPYECRLLQLVFLDKSAHVLSHGRVVMARIVGRVAMVAKVLHPIFSSPTSKNMSGPLKNEERSHALSLTRAYIDLPRSRARALQPSSIFLSVQDWPSRNILADTAIVFLGSKQAVHKQNRRRPVWVVRDRFGWLVEVVNQGHSIGGGRAV